ncbi:MAG: NAD-dependent epimerase/dehydratase family protein [Planctomycetaceae bacterium]|nr:NAD-dependent epimerase/dehydratase family protein [Planctomycetaceae bacterium]
MIDFKTDSILVTGAAGWLGQALLRALVQGIPDVPALAQPTPGLRIRALVAPGENAAGIRAVSPSIEIVEGDLRSPEVCARFCKDAAGGLLFAAAGIIHPRRIADLYEVNRDGTVNTVRAAAAAGLRRAVVVSSNSPCGCNPAPDHRFDEEAPYRPYLNYGRSKMEMEQRVRELQGIETVIVRPTWFYGPWQPPRQTLFFKMIRDGKAPIVGSGEGRRSMSYVDNTSQGLILAATVAQAAGKTYWLADERPYSMNEIVDTVERLLEREFGQTCAHKRLRLPGIASSVAYAIDTVAQACGIYLQKIHVLSEMNKTIACSVDRAKKELGYAPTVALEEGMRRSLKWVVDNGQLA